MLSIYDRLYLTISSNGSVKSLQPCFLCITALDSAYQFLVSLCKNMCTRELAHVDIFLNKNFKSLQLVNECKQNMGSIQLSQRSIELFSEPATRDTCKWLLSSDC